MGQQTFTRKRLRIVLPRSENDVRTEGISLRMDRPGRFRGLCPRMDPYMAEVMAEAGFKEQRADRSRAVPGERRASFTLAGAPVSPVMLA